MNGEGFPAEFRKLAMPDAVSLVANCGSRQRSQGFSRFLTTALLIVATLQVVVGNRAWAAEETLDSLTNVLKSGDEKARIAAIDAIGQKGPAAKPAVPALVRQLSDSAPIVRGHAAHALEMIGPAAQEAVDALAKLVTDPDMHVRRVAAHALQEIHPKSPQAVAALVKALDDSDPSVRVGALGALTEAGDLAVAPLVAALAKPATRYWAVLALGELGPVAKPAITPLTGLLNDESAETRREALIALGRIGPDAAPVVDAIAKRLEDSDPTVRTAAAFVLGEIGPAAASAVAALKKQETGASPLMAAASAWAVARIEPGNKAAQDEAIKLLSEALKNENPRVQGFAFRGLVQLEPGPEQLVPVLTQILSDSKSPLVNDALYVLGSLGEAAGPAIATALARPESRGRTAAMVAALGPKAKAAIPGLTAALRDDNPDVRREVLFALAAMGPEAASAQIPVVEALDDPEVRVRSVAAYTLGRIGPAAKNAIPVLRKNVESSDSVVRVASAWALAHIATHDAQVVREVVPVLIQGLQAESEAVRRGSADALGLIGKPAREAESALKAATQDPDETVRKAALHALEKIGAIVDAPRQKPANLKRQ